MDVFEEEKDNSFPATFDRHFSIVQLQKVF